MATFHGLRALNHAERLAVEGRRLADRLPPREHELADQLRRAVTSVALNIAEGSLRTSYKDYRRFLDTARSGLKEVEIILRIMHLSDHLTDAEFTAIDAIRDETARTLYGLLRSVVRKIENGETRRSI